jgi:hypothetical protein
MIHSYTVKIAGSHNTEGSGRRVQSMLGSEYQARARLEGRVQKRVSTLKLRFTPTNDKRPRKRQETRSRQGDITQQNTNGLHMNSI